MAKCSICNSCLKIVRIPVDPIRYFVCNFCKVVYKLDKDLTPNSKEIIMDNDIIKSVGKETGWKIE